jgi:hypothetical protein
MSFQKTMKNFAKNVTSGKNKYVLVGLIITAIVAYLIVGPLDLMSVGGSYSSAYEGAKASISGITYNGKTYSSNSYNPYYLSSGTGFSFKGDGPSAQYSGLPKIVGEMTPVFIPEATNAGDLPAVFDVGGVKIGNPFTNSFGLIKNPYNSYSWTVTRSSTKTLYTMEEWKTKLYVSISANPDGASVPFANSEWDQPNGRYSDIQVWIKLDTAPTWYFQGQEKAYFAIAQVQLAGVSYGGHDQSGTVQASHNQQNIIVNPSSPSSIVNLYKRNFGVGGSEASDPETIYSYKGTTLNPQYFGNAVYFPITLNSFGSQSWWDWGTFYGQGDVVTFDFTVTQFVVGQWTVQNTQAAPEGYGRQSSYSEYGFSGVTDFFNELGSNPLYQMIILGIIIIALAGILIFFFPKGAKLLDSAFGAAHKGAKSASKKIKATRKKSKKKI